MNHEERVNYIHNLFKKKDWDTFAQALVKHINLNKEESIKEIFQEHETKNDEHVVQQNIEIFTQNL